MAFKKYCSECGVVIECSETYLVGDVTGDVYCLECGDNHVAVTTVYPEGNTRWDGKMVAGGTFERGE